MQKRAEKPTTLEDRVAKLSKDARRAGEEIRFLHSELDSVSGAIQGVALAVQVTIAGVNKEIPGSGSKILELIERTAAALPETAANSRQRQATMVIVRSIVDSLAPIRQS